MDSFLKMISNNYVRPLAIWSNYRSYILSTCTAVKFFPLLQIPPSSGAGERNFSVCVWKYTHRIKEPAGVWHSREICFNPHKPEVHWDKNESSHSKVIDLSEPDSDWKMKREMYFLGDIILVFQWHDTGFIELILFIVARTLTGCDDEILVKNSLLL